MFSAAQLPLAEFDSCRIASRSEPRIESGVDKLLQHAAGEHISFLELEDILYALPTGSRAAVENAAAAWS